MKEDNFKEQEQLYKPIHDKMMEDGAKVVVVERENEPYCIECGYGEKDGTFQYHRIVANGREYYCTNCKKYQLV